MRLLARRSMLTIAAVALAFSLAPARALPPLPIHCRYGDNCICTYYYSAYAAPKDRSEPIVIVKQELCVRVPWRD